MLVPEERFSSHDITSRRFWGQTFDVRDETFAQLRAAEGLSWHPPLPSVFDTTEPGFWALTRRADIVHASLHPELFSSAHGIALDPMPADLQRVATFFLMIAVALRFYGDDIRIFLEKHLPMAALALLVVVVGGFFVLPMVL